MESRASFTNIDVVLVNLIQVDMLVSGRRAKGGGGAGCGGGVRMSDRGVEGSFAWIILSSGFSYYAMGS